MKNNIIGYTVVNRTPFGIGMPLTPRGSLIVASTPAMMAELARQKGIPGAPEPVYFWHMVSVLYTGDGYAMTRDAMKNFNQSLRDNQAEMEKFKKLPLKEVEVPADAAEYWLYDYRLNIPPDLSAVLKANYVRMHSGK